MGHQWGFMSSDKQPAVDIAGRVIKPCLPKALAPRSYKAPAPLKSAFKMRQMSGTIDRKTLTSYLTEQLSSLGSKATETVPTLVEFFEQQSLFTAPAIQTLPDSSVKELLQLPEGPTLLTIGIRKALFGSNPGMYGLVNCGSLYVPS